MVECAIISYDKCTVAYLEVGRMSQQVMLGGWVQLSVRLPQNLDKALKKQAEVEDRPVARVVRRALVQYLERQKAQDRCA